MKLIIEISEGIYKHIDTIQNGSIGAKQILNAVKDGIPAYKAIPNKIGRWIDQDEGAKHSRECNQCGKEPLLDEYGDYVFSKYCPNCGIKMDCTILD